VTESVYAVRLEPKDGDGRLDQVAVDEASRQVPNCGEVTLCVYDTEDFAAGAVCCLARRMAGLSVCLVFQGCGRGVPDEFEAVFERARREFLTVEAALLAQGVA
jgi:hypothetical protein